jgi:hypothetical protein
MLPPDYIYVKIFPHTVTRAVYHEDKKGYVLEDHYHFSFADMTSKENVNKLKDFESGKVFTSLVFKEYSFKYDSNEIDLSSNVSRRFTFEYEVFLDPQLAFKPSYTL